MHRICLALLCTVAFLLTFQATTSGFAADDLDKTFATVPDANKPWAYWWWLNANVTKESITHELEELKAKGVGGVLLFDVTAYGHHLVPAPERKIPFMSHEWRELVKFAISRGRPPGNAGEHQLEYVRRGAACPVGYGRTRGQTTHLVEEDRHRPG